MILIADSGGTKVEWCLIDRKGEVQRLVTLGMNALMVSVQEMTRRISAEVAAPLGKFGEKVRKIYFYGAGCVSPAVGNGVRLALSANFADAEEIYVCSDLVGTARALCGDEPGIACILGTGSNSCYYDGKEISRNVSALGYILGDEGSGAYLGKILVSDVLKEQLPADVRDMFLKEYPITAVEVIQRVYRQPGAQGYLAAFTPFLKAHLDHPTVYGIVYDAFCAFFRRNVSVYGKPELPVNFVGSIAYYYKDVLKKAAEDCGFHIGCVIKTPVDRLVKYHLQRIDE